MISRKILVVDEHKPILHTVVQALEALGHQVFTATDERDAFMQLTAEEYDLMLLDLKLPRINGLEFLQQVVEMQPNLPVIVMSAYGTIDNAIEAMKLGAVDFLEKPFTPPAITKNNLSDFRTRNSRSREN